MFADFSGHKLRFCAVCNDDRFHFRLEGEGCVAFLCRSCILSGRVKAYATDTEVNRAKETLSTFKAQAT
jgi:late competence protein required for DNA uptake (superfamily II DNA/RNA helicase)